MGYKSFLHVERIDKEEIIGLLDYPVYVSPKIDGTNSVVYWDSDNDCIGAGSRKRAISIENDNAGFAAWLKSDSEEAMRLCRTAYNWPGCIIYGEWLGQNKFIGAIKQYDVSALGHLWIFDVYDTKKDCYLTPSQVEAFCRVNHLSEWLIPHTLIENPTLEKIKEAAESNTFMMNEGYIGEGVVVKGANLYYNKYGNFVYGKYVNDSFKETKHKAKEPIPEGEIEKWIVETYLTEAEMGKAKAKILNLLDLDEIKGNGKAIGMYLNLCFNDMVEENITEILKKKKRPIINFNSLQSICNDKARKYIGL